MPYRLLLQTTQGDNIGYENRELTDTEFADVAQGRRPTGDTDAQSRQGAEGKTVVYAGVWRLDTMELIATAESADLEALRSVCWKATLP